MTAYIYLLNGKIHMVKDCINIVCVPLDESLIFQQYNKTLKHSCSSIKYLEKDIANVSLEI